MESDRVCHASAIMATDPVTTPAQYFKAKSPVFMKIESHPSIYAYLLADFIRFSNLSCLNPAKYSRNILYLFHFYPLFIPLSVEVKSITSTTLRGMLFSQTDESLVPRFKRLNRAAGI